MPALDQITIEGFKSIKALVDFKLGPLNVLIGANGAGKSNLIGFFGLLTHLVERQLQQYVAKQGGANALLYNGVKTTHAIQAKVVFGSNAYQVALALALPGGLYITREAGYRDDGRLSFEFGAGNLESNMADPAHPAWPALEPLVLALQSCRIYHFHDTSETAGIKMSGPVNDNRILRPDASNLAAFLRTLRLKEAQRYARIRETIQLAAPFFDDFILEPTAENPDVIRLEWRQLTVDRPFLAHQLSDGTLRFIALTVLLLQPAPPPLIILDEPELGLHPVAMDLLASLLREATDRPARPSQLLISTQSPLLLNHFEPEHVIVVDRVAGGSRFRRLESAPLQEWLNDYSLGELVHKNVIEAGPRYE